MRFRLLLNTSLIGSLISILKRRVKKKSNFLDGLEAL
jgi:hypothetical protein